MSLDETREGPRRRERGKFRAIAAAGAAAARFEGSDPSRPIPFSDPWVAKQMNSWRCPAEHPDGWRHNPPERVFLVLLDGRAAFEVSTGETFELGPDLAGAGNDGDGSVDPASSGNLFQTGGPSTPQRLDS